MHERPAALAVSSVEGPDYSSNDRGERKRFGAEPSGEAPSEGFPDAAAFPALPIATNSQRMLDLFRAHLKTTSGRAVDIQGCKPFRFRCRQGTSEGRCILQYTLRMADPLTGQQWDQWVTGLLYADSDEAVRVGREMQVSKPRRERPDHRLALESVGFIPELGMPVEVFPYDRKLPTLGAVMDGALDVLDPRLLARLGPGQWQVEERVIEPTRYRTERGAALEYTIRAHDTQSARRESVRCFLKVYRGTRGEDTWQLLRSISQRADNGRPYSVVTPIVYLRELRTLAMEEAPGRALNELLREDDPTEAVRSVAQAMAAFNQDDIPISHRESRSDRLEDLRKASSLAQWACPAARGAVQRIAGAVADGLDDAPCAPIHGDMKPDHAFVSGNRVTFIDLDSAALGDPVRDPAQLVAYMAAQIRMDSVPAGRLRKASSTFVEEYFRHVPASWRPRFSIHHANALLEVATAIFRMQEPGWPARVMRIVEMAEHALSDSLG